MQILPDTLDQVAASAAYAEQASLVVTPSTPFADLMQRLSDNAAAVDSYSEDALAASRRAARQQAGEHGMGQGLKMTREDFADLREKLLKQGLSEEDVRELEDKVNGEEGLTWKGFLTFIADKLNVNIGSLGIELDASMRNELKALFQKLGFSLDEGKALIQDIEDGEHVRVWQKLSTTIRGLPLEDLKNITRSELTALAGAMRLSAGSVQRIDSMLGGAFADSEPTPQGVRAALNVILAESAKIQKNLDSTLGDMRQLIEKGIRIARNRARMESLSDNRETREVSSAKVLIEDEAKKHYRSDKNDPTHVEKGSDSAANSARSKAGEDKSGASGNKDAPVPQNVNAKERADSVEERLHQSFGKSADKNETGKAGTQGEQAADNGKDGKDQKAWESLWGKVQTRDETVQTKSADEARYFSGELSRTSQDTTENRLRENLPSQRILRTVQDGVLQNLRQGGKQLTLRLDPPSLGKLVVILQVHNKDVRAVLRTENAEVSKIIHDQIGAIRHTLETQGLKVDKIDVQTQTPGEQQARDWQGAEHHNLAQERERQEQMRSTLRTMRSLHMLNKETEPLAQDVQSSEVRENIAQHGLYVIA
jgi:flagellar hook-length control protein FliK